MKRTIEKEKLGDILGEAEKIKLEKEDKLTVAEVKDIADEAGVPQQYIEESIKRVDDREAATQEANQVRREWLARIGKAAGVFVVVLILFVTVHSMSLTTDVRNAYSGMEQRKAQVDNVIARRKALYEALKPTDTASPLKRKLEKFADGYGGAASAIAAVAMQESDLERDKLAEIAGAETRISVEKRRYDAAVRLYNDLVKTHPVGGLPNQVPYSGEVSSWR